MLVLVFPHPVFFMDRTDFLNRRRLGIGGSDLAAVFGMQPYGCPRRLWYEKTGAEPDYPDKQENHDIARGVAMEPLIINMFAEKTGMQVKKIDSTIASSDFPWLQVHIDVFAFDGESWYPVEVKSMGKENFRKLKREGVSPAYILQVQHELARCNMPAGYFVAHCCDMWNDLIFFKVNADARIQEASDRAATEFWHRHVLTGEPPEKLSVEDDRCKSCAFRWTCQGDEIDRLIKASGAVVEYDASASPLLAQYLAADERAKICEEELQEIRARIIEVLGKRKGVDTPDGKAVLSSFTRQSFSNEAIRASRAQMVEILQALEAERGAGDATVEKLKAAMAAIYTTNNTQVTTLRAYPPRLGSGR